jgi:hypothetical protein
MRIDYSLIVDLVVILLDAFDCGCDSTAMAESFYYSNVVPQLPTLNRGGWKSLRNRFESWQKGTTVFSCGVAQSLLRIGISEG